MQVHYMQYSRTTKGYFGWRSVLSPIREERATRRYAWSTGTRPRVKASCIIWSIIQYNVWILCKIDETLVDVDGTARRDVLCLCIVCAHWLRGRCCGGQPFSRCARDRRPARALATWRSSLHSCRMCDDTVHYTVVYGYKLCNQNILKFAVWTKRKETIGWKSTRWGRREWWWWWQRLQAGEQSGSERAARNDRPRAVAHRGQRRSRHHDDRYQLYKYKRAYKNASLLNEYW